MKLFQKGLAALLALVALLPACAATGRPKGATPEAGAPARVMDLEAYLARRGPGDPDPRSHMATLITLAKNNRQAAIAHCAAQSPPVPADQCSGGVPFCASIVDRRTDTVVATGCNHGSANPIFHGEIAAMNNFANILQARGIPYSDVSRYHDLYTTGESCAMCMGAVMWWGFHTVFFGSDLDFLEQFYDQIAISDQELSGLWKACQVKDTTVRTQVVGGVLEAENNALFQEFGTQFCAAATSTSDPAHDH